ncbi:PilN domain-containing protein [Thermobrachium celere]|uniref:Fimbrial assembly family protein n=1 Tax=Thermobrachium celere DSM 8682 TaxID=941824 RepID=R7RN70_9CLOT|nr:PilN domain-containing protein [Thermobrachium celere]CDF57617.1 Fimbrial assembly family protein [Thermobrachium celere DSM 8682]
MLDLQLNRGKDINLLEAYNRQYKKNTENNKKIFIFLISEIVVFLLITIISITKIIYYKVQNTKLTQEINNLIPIENQVKEYTKIKMLYESKKTIFDAVSKDNETLNLVIKNLEEITPSEMAIENMTLSKDKVSFVIKSSKEENIAQFVYNMQNSYIFKNIVFNGISNQGTEKRTSITAEIVRK